LDGTRILVGAVIEECVGYNLCRTANSSAVLASVLSRGVELGPCTEFVVPKLRAAVPLAELQAWLAGEA